MQRIRRHPQLLDAALAGVLLVAGLADTARRPELLHPVTELFVLLSVGAIALRSRAPLLMCVVAAAGLAGFGLLPETTTPLWGFVAVLVLAFSAGANLGGRLRLAGVLALLVAAYILQVATSARLRDGEVSWADVWITPLVLIGVPALAGGLLRHSRAQTRRVRELAAELAVERDHHAAAAAAAERNRIARELHDVISHSVSVMLVQAGAAEALLPPAAPALQPVLRVRSAGRDALAELRRQLGLLTDGPGPGDPMPGLDDLRSLVAGVDGQLEVVGDLDGISSPGVQLTAYRVVQEGLTNARRHANGGSARVRVVRSEAAIEVTVLDSGGGDGGGEGGATSGGYGLRGMRERVELYGGELTAGPRGDAPGWRLCATLPLEQR
ncbi:sensor histidine kinase [Flexivirga oryzae]|uniref:histidine kinase n=1 Tax=Flexivirga oryzae TaxID=1794944 RepID=A0A839ND76_9MICO|nr:histidine kinase [Flexivirga oryzae]MBB2892641.1 signal transduction histidine kinase [Flexivirga oryzae]